jgi:hypothetical protein
MLPPNNRQDANIARSVGDPDSDGQNLQGEARWRNGAQSAVLSSEPLDQLPTLSMANVSGGK